MDEEGQRLFPEGDCLQNRVKRDAILCKLYQRAHDCVMFHGSDQHMITGFQKSFQENIQTGGDVPGEDHILSFSGREMKEPKKLFTGFKNLFFHRISSPVSAAVYIHGRTGQIVVDCFCHRRRLWKRRTCLIQIYFIRIHIHKKFPQNNIRKHQVRILFDFDILSIMYEYQTMAVL